METIQQIINPKVGEYWQTFTEETCQIKSEPDSNGIVEVLTASSDSSTISLIKLPHGLTRLSTDKEVEEFNTRLLRLKVKIKDNLYHYRAFVKRVYDGDTITVDLDLGFFTWIKAQTIRLAGIDAPEIRGEERPLGLISGMALRGKILNKEVVIVTDKDRKGKYGRWLGTVYLEGENINSWLLNEGLAKPYEG